MSFISKHLENILQANVCSPEVAHCTLLYKLCFKVFQGERKARAKNLRQERESAGSRNRKEGSMSRAKWAWESVICAVKLERSPISRSPQKHRTEVEGQTCKFSVCPTSVHLGTMCLEGGTPFSNLYKDTINAAGILEGRCTIPFQTSVTCSPGGGVKNPQETEVLYFQTVKNPQETEVWSLGREDPLEKGMASQSSILVWRIPWTGEPGGLQPMGSQRVRRDWATNTNKACPKATVMAEGALGLGFFELKVTLPLLFKTIKG